MNLTVRPFTSLRAGLAFLMASGFAGGLVGCTHPAPQPPVPAPNQPATTPTRPPTPPPTAGALPTDDTPKLPPIPLVEGPLAIHVVFPSEGAPLAATDS